MTRVAVVIPSRFGARLLAECLPAVLGQSRPPDEVLVVDDGAGADADAVEARSAGVRALRLPRRVGHAGAVAAGVSATGGDVVAVLNNDTVPMPDWLEQGLGALDDPAVGSVATLLVDADTRLRIDSAGDAYSAVGLAWKRLEGRPADEAGALRSEPFSACAGAALFRRRALEACGGFDPRLDGYYDDVDVGARLRLAGFRCVLAPSSRCAHRVSASYGANPRHREYLIARNASLVFWSVLPARTALRGLAGALMLGALQAGRRLPTRALAPWMTGKLAAVARPAEIRARRRWVRSLSRPEATLVGALDPAWIGALRRRATA